MRVLVTLIAALALVGAATAGGPRIVGIGEQKDGETKKAHVGDTLVVTVSGTRATGTWRLGTYNRTVLRFDSSAYLPAKRPPLFKGAAGVFVFIFKVAARGTTKLNLHYISAGATAKTFSVTINAVARGV
jgi:predicted secreted protein